MIDFPELSSLASESLGPVVSSLNLSKECPSSILSLLDHRNGFYAFEQALHVFPVGSDVTGTMTFEDWNSFSLWRNAYEDLANGLFFFAEDAFGDQFCTNTVGTKIFRFEAESAALVEMADSMQGWWERILQDYDSELGWSFISEWQKTHGPLKLGYRLQPKIPFIYGGKYEQENFWAGDSVNGMLFKAELALKIRDLPEGTEIELRVKDSGSDSLS